MGSSSKRVDLVIFRDEDNHNQENVWILIECTRDTIEPKNKNDGVDQLKSYLAACPNAEWGMWRNGRSKEVIRKVREGRRTLWEEPNDIPSADGAQRRLIGHPEANSNMPPMTTFCSLLKFVTTTSM